MSKIEHVFYPQQDPNIKKQKSKKSDKSKFKDSSKSNVSSFEDRLFTKELELDIENIDQTKEKVELLLKQIGNQGEKLKKSRLLEDLDKYKKFIKEYISIVILISEETVNKTLWDRKKKEKVTKVHLKVINEELLELTRIFLEEQQNTLAIASKIDRIEGLLVDLRS